MIKYIYFLFISIFLSSTKCYGSSPYVQCFQRTIRRSIDNSQPLMELFYVTPHNCIDQCVSMTGNNQDESSDCKSIVYNHFQHSCRLYNHDGNTPPSIIHPAIGYDYFRRTAFSGPCTPTIAYELNSHGILNNDNYNSQTAAQFNELQKRQPPQNKIQRPKFGKKADSNTKEPLTIVAASSPILNSISPLSINGQSKNDEKTKVQDDLINTQQYTPSQQTKIYHSNEPKPESTGGVFKSLADDVNSPPNSAKELGYISSNEKSKEILMERMGSIQESTTKKALLKSSEVLKTSKGKSEEKEEEEAFVEVIKKCDTTIGYYVVIGNQIILPMQSNTKDVTTFQGIDQSKCSNICSIGKGPNGQKIVCNSINYFPISKTCELYSILAEPHGTGSLIENDNVIYSEKFCLPPSSMVCQDDEIFILHVQKNLNTNIIGTSSANSITSCLSLCLNSKNCKASTFDSENSLCKLSSTNIGENVDVLSDGEPGTVVIENGCNMRKRKSKVRGSKTFSNEINKESHEIPIQSDLQWTEWSDCRYKIAGRNVRIRTRHCDINCADGGLQLEKC